MLRPTPVVPRFTFKAKFKVPKKADDSLFYDSQRTQEVSASTQENSEEVENLLDGLDEDSIFGDFWTLP
jgi:hypothetical protein